VYQQPVVSQQERTESQASAPMSAVAHWAWPDEPAVLAPPVAEVPPLPPLAEEPPFAAEPLEPPLPEKPPLPLEPPAPEQSAAESPQVPFAQHTAESQ